MIVANHHPGALGGEGPDTYFCGGQGHVFDIQVSALCAGHRAMHELFDDPEAADNFTYPEGVPAVGTVGDNVTVATQFDGWSYVHLYDAATGQELDTFAIPEAMDPAYASGFGELTVHEVATDPTDPSLAYLSFYSGGLRALQIQCSNPADDPNVEGDEVLILASDRDYGLFIFRDP